jgi:cell division protein FtsI/penicillin-binding protein 2
MMRFYAALAGDGTSTPPYLVDRPKRGAVRQLGLTPAQLIGLRIALCRVVQSGTAAASGGRELQVCGKTGTAQSSRKGDDHGWFLGYAPANNPRIIVGSIMESLGGHGGATVAPYVVQVIKRYLTSQDSTLLRAKVRVPVLEDSVTGVSTPPDTARQ